MSGPWRFLRALRLHLLGPEKQLVGTDQFGNKYYAIPKHQTWAAWLRKRRKDPPTMEEIFKNEICREEIKLKIAAASEKDSPLQTKEYEGLVAEPVQTQIKGHASSPYYGKNEPSPDPSSTAKTFQPGSWIPPDSSSRNK
ncbi:NADH dehydrogenase [ubiquinone] 1 alpha subcomplex assembly factor 2 isoform X2 [Mauremys reevesii]|uniref:NADH dehydrogenase [ubiquinone] 1 alpha subcomplex assembly factor 2 isoform X2 n=1 Tax=Mauremys reevesii TaxID=260615 RepID=UPI00193FC995|nr:NADH dehydrogenase [ubiquinone] 1 alpha subcomplex assembly factor 2 isoform X2 [Mauremys reevesii]